MRGVCGDSSETFSETGNCTRDTDGDECGSTSYGAWSACGGFNTSCDEIGTRSRTLYIDICDSGRCDGERLDTETDSCSRVTDGNYCAPCKSCSNGNCMIDDSAGGCAENQTCSGGVCVQQTQSQCLESTDISWSSDATAICPNLDDCVAPDGTCVSVGSTKPNLNPGGDDDTARCISSMT